jgi:catechol 2,3-dioxygenase
VSSPSPHSAPAGSGSDSGSRSAWLWVYDGSAKSRWTRISTTTAAGEPEAQKATVETSPRDPEELEATGAPASAGLSASTAIGAVRLTVSALERSLEYYGQVIGLEILHRDGAAASLGVAGRELLHLVEETGARPASGHTGLYHFALLVRERVDLARWLAHAARDRVPLVGLSDHFVSEALYLSDPDEHGIEIYWDRPREVWEGQVAARMTTLPLDVEGLLGELGDPRSEPFDGLAPGTVMGHVHLKVADIPETIAFYRDVVGLALMAQLGPYAAFLSAGGYHHHLGANTWESAGASPPPPGSAALRYATIVLPDDRERVRLIDRIERSGQTPRHSAAGPVIRDPSGNGLVLALDSG